MLWIDELKKSPQEQGSENGLSTKRIIFNSDDDWDDNSDIDTASQSTYSWKDRFKYSA